MTEVLQPMAELEAAVRDWMAVQPAQKNGQVREVPDARTIRYYTTIGLVDPPASFHGRKALYTTRHLAQVIAIKRFQLAGKSLAEIQALWPKVDDEALAKLTGIPVPPRRKPRAAFWKDAPRASEPRASYGTRPPAVELRIQLDGNVSLLVAAPDGIAMTTADLDALRVAAAPLLDELAKRGLTANDREEQKR